MFTDVAVLWSGQSFKICSSVEHHLKNSKHRFAVSEGLPHAWTRLEMDARALIESTVFSLIRKRQISPVNLRLENEAKKENIENIIPPITIVVLNAEAGAYRIELDDPAIDSPRLMALTRPTVFRSHSRSIYHIASG